jgi:hypothetical protein
MPEVRALPSTGVTRLRRYYDPVRLPPWPPTKSALRPLPPPRRVSPVTCSTFPTCHAQYPGGPQRGHLPVTSPPRAAFPDPVAGRHPRLHFRGLLRLHSRYGPLDCSAARGGLCHKAPIRPVTRPHRLSATRATDFSPDGIFLHRCYTPSGRTLDRPVTDPAALAQQGPAGR